MNWVDLVVMLLMLVSALLAFSRGFVREVLGIGSWAAAGVFAIWAFSSARDRFRVWIPNGEFADVAAFGALFVIALFFLTVAASWGARLVQDSVLSGIDRTFGLLFGLVRGAALLVAAYIIVGLVVPLDHWPDDVQEARCMPLIYRGAAFVAEIMPEGYRPSVSMPPGVHETPAADLLRLLPQGRAVVRP